MQLVFSMFLLLMILLRAGFSSSTDLLQNVDFESPPTNVSRRDAASEFIPLENGINTLPGWSIEGSVIYVTSGKTVSLQRKGSHGVQLGPSGYINQTFVTAGDSSSNASTYLLTVTLAYSLLAGSKNCTASAATAVWLFYAATNRTDFQPRDGYKGNSFGAYLGYWGDGERINFLIDIVGSDSDPVLTCWPIVDSVLLKTIGGGLAGNKSNLLPNGGFELGPQFVTGSTDGILLTQPLEFFLSPLLQWTILGTIKYIDSDHFFVPAGNAAIEMISGNSSGIQTAVSLRQGSSYTLEFTLGDANDSCVGDLTVRAQAGSTLNNYLILSTGTGSGKSFSMTFNASSGATLISFISLTTTKTKDGVFCGPIIDGVVLQASLAIKVALSWNFMVLLLLFTVAAAAI